ncbi:MAG: glycosyltransferase family 2 protein [Blautia sp.]|nr:glycosyltransferase family 2 protein [Blautia sp.]
MTEVSVVIPNYNGRAFLDGVLRSLRSQRETDFETIVVDNGSTDDSCGFIEKNYPEVRIVKFPDNRGFASAVNEGIRNSRGKYVILLNNDTEADENFTAELTRAIKRHKKAFSCQAKMINMKDRSVMDDAGDYYCAFGWAFARGKGRDASGYNKEERIFSSCAGAAIYRRKALEKLGMFDDEHFAYLEDLDVGYRARLKGYENWYAPRAVVYHVGSGTSGSRYNQFKTRYSSRNNVYMIYKNMPAAQLILNLPFLAAGFGVKLAYFTLKGFGREYAAGIVNGFRISRPEKKVGFDVRFLPCYLQIQAELFINMVRFFTKS